MLWHSVILGQAKEIISVNKKLADLILLIFISIKITDLIYSLFFIAFMQK